VAHEPSISSGGAAARYNDNPDAHVWLEKSVTIRRHGARPTGRESRVQHKHTPR
jgi:hypothetical protein